MEGKPRLAKCECGHTGNVEGSEHGPLMRKHVSIEPGHGACLKCGDCVQFTWAGFVDEEHPPGKAQLIFADLLRCAIAAESEGGTQDSVAALYALLIGAGGRQLGLGDQEFWGAVHAPILARWPSGLERVKEKAWAKHEGISAQVRKWLEGRDPEEVLRGLRGTLGGGDA